MLIPEDETMEMGEIGRKQMEESDRNNNTPLHIAAFNGYSEIVQVWSMQYAAKMLTCVFFQWLLKSNCAICTKNENGKTSIHLAAQEGHEHVVQQLVESGEQGLNCVLEKDEDSNTPLHLSAARGHTFVAKTLLDYGAEVNAR